MNAANNTNLKKLRISPPALILAGGHTMIQGIVGWRNLSITQLRLAKRYGEGLPRGEGAHFAVGIRQRAGAGHRGGKSDTRSSCPARRPVSGVPPCEQVNSSIFGLLPTA